MVQRIGSRYGPDKDEHDEAHALLAVIGAVAEADAGAGEHQQGADEEWWRLFAFGSDSK